MPALDLILAVAAGYLLGAIPSGVIVGRLRGVDPRSGGSGRTGTTNALRTLGTGLALVVLVLDLGKGALAVVAGGAIASSDPWAGPLAGAAAVIGHVRSVFIGFRGGRGVATGAGVMLVLAPLAVLASVPVFATAVGLTRYVSLGSLLAALTVAGAAAVMAAAGWVAAEVAAAGVIIATVVVLAHADNIARLRSGTERRFGRG